MDRNGLKKKYSGTNIRKFFMAREILKIKTYVDGKNDLPFPSAEEQIGITEYTYTSKRMGNVTLSARLMHRRCLDKLWTGLQYVEFRGEKYFISATPSSGKDNEDARYEHTLSFIPERDLKLNNVYFYDAVSEESTGDDKYKSNSTNVVFFGTIEEFVARLNESLKYSGLDYTVVIDDGITSEAKLMSFEDQFFFNVLQKIYNTYGLPFYFVGKVIHIGFTSNAITQTFKYGFDNELLSIKKNNANYRIINRCTGTGSEDNIPYYYPNSSPKGDITAEAGASNTGIVQAGIKVTDYDKFSAGMAVGQSVRYVLPAVSGMRYSKNGPYDWEDSLTAITATTGLHQGETARLQIFIEGTVQKPGTIKFPVSFTITPLKQMPVGLYFDSKAGIFSDDAYYDFHDESGARYSVGGSDPVPEKFNNIENGQTVLITTSKAGTLRMVLQINITIGFSGGIIEGGLPSGDDGYYTGRVSFLAGVDTKSEGFWTLAAEGAEDIEKTSLSSIGLAVTGTPADGDTITQELKRYITPSKYLMPPVYRESLGAERFYNALNDTYTNPDTGEKYVFENIYDPAIPREHKQEFGDIKPTIKGMTNAAGQRMDQILDIAFDLDDNDEVDEEGKYLHPYFFVKLPKYDGDYGFNLFDHAIDEEEMSVSMTSGQCGACEFIIGVSDDEAQRNLVQVDSQGGLLRDEDGNVRCGRKGMPEESPQDRQNDTVNYEVWIALKKEESTYGQIMPNAQQNLKPAKGDIFVILHIDLPQAYILNAENELKESIIKYMAQNNSEKFNFSITFSRIYLEEHPDIESQLNENARIQVEYDGVRYEFYISQYTYKCLDEEALPEISVEITDTVTVNKTVLQNTADAIMGSVNTSIGNIDFLMQGLRYFIRKDVDDVALGRIVFSKGIQFGTYSSGFLGSGGAVLVDPSTGATTAEFDFLTVRRKAVFKELTVEEMTHAGGQIIVSPASMVCSSVEDTGDAYRCYFETEDADGASVYNQFAPGDQARCQTFNMWGNRSYWRLVTGTGRDYIDLSKEDADTGSDIPQAGDRIVQLGNREDTGRQAAQIISCFGENSPSYVMYNGINSYSLVDKNITGIIYNQQTQEPQMYSYGSFYFGDRDISASDATFITYQQREGDTKKKLFIQADVKLGPGSSGLGNLDEWGDLDQSIKDLAQAAEDAQKAAEDAQDAADAAQKEIDGWVADGVISPLEKQGLKNEVARIKADYEDVQSGYSKYGLGNPTDYNLAYVEYYNVLSEILSSPEQNVPVPSNFDTIQDTYYDRWVDALEAIAAAAKDAVSQAQEDANTAQDTADEALQKANEAKDYIDNTLPDEIANINKKLDGVVETWFYPYSPTLSNEPAATWIKDGEQEKHIGDMFLNNQEYVDDETTPDAGKAWRWEKNTSGAYFWNQVADSDAVKALQDAAKAQDTADQKRRVFVTTPYTPYDVGDMWTQGASGDIMRCIKARATGNYAASDWEKASKYTDDAVAQDALAKADAAQDAADAAQDAADAAQSAASKAQSTADNAVADASDANKQLANLMSDNVITPPEKTALKQQHSDIKAEYTQIIADAQKYGVSTTTYTNAYNSANTALTKYTAASPENITVGSDYSNISAYYTARQTILNAIATAAKKVADAAQDAADTAQDAADAAQSTADSAAASASQALKDAAAAQSAIQEVRGDLNGLNDTVSDLDEYLDGAFRDGVINDAESISIKKYINTVNESWTDLQASYNVVYNNANLTGTPKTNLKSAYDTLSTRKTSLINAINAAVSDPSSTKVAAVDTAFTSYNSAVSSFKTALENATKSIEDAIRTAANNAAAAALQAQNDATAAAGAAETAKQEAEAASQRLNDWASDSYISPTEKPAIKDEIARIDADNDQIEDGYLEYGLGTPASYNNAYSTYRAQLVALSKSTPENISIPSTFRTNQSTYYSLRSDALAAIAVAAKTVVDNINIGVTNIASNGRLNMSDISSYHIADLRFHKKLVVGKKYTAILSGAVSGSQKIGIWDSSGTSQMGYFSLKSGRIYQLTFTFNKSSNAVSDRVSLFNYPSSGSAANPADIDWVCVYEGDVKAPDIFMEAPEDMLAGGVNLALKTNQGVTGWSWTMQTGSYTKTEVTEDGIRCCRLTRDTVAQSGWSVILYGNSYINRAKLTAGKTYTVSFEVKSSVASTFNVSFMDGDGTDAMESKTEYRNNSAAANTWTKIVAVLTMKDTLPSSTAQTLYLTHMASGTGVSHTFRNLMIEEGSIPTTWKAAPEDTDAAIAAVSESVEGIKNFTDTAFADGVIDRAEAASIEKYKNSVNETLKSVTGTYNTLYNNTNLTGTPKSNLKTAYDSLVSAINALLNSIDTAIADSKTNATEKEDVDSKYNTVNTRMQTYTQAVEAANESIQAAIKAIADNANNRLNNLEYLEAVFPNSNIIANGALIGQMAVVTDKAPTVSGAKVVAGLNGTDIGKDSTHGKVLMFAGSGGVTDADIKGAKTKIYEDGRIDTASAKIEGALYATSGRIGAFWTTSSNSFVSQAIITYTSGTHTGKKAKTELNLNPVYAYYRAKEEYDGADITVSVGRETDISTEMIAVYDKDGNLLYQTLGAETRGGLFAKMTASNPSSNTMYAAITAHSDCPGSYASAAFLAEKGMFAGLRPLTKVVSSSYRLTEYDYNVLVLGTGTVILTLDTPPQDGQHYTIWKPNKEFTLTIRGNGRLIHRIGTGDASEVTIAKADVVLIEVTYFEDGNKWFLIIHDYR